MLEVTESAKQELKKKIQSHTDDPEIGLRLTITSAGGFNFTPTRERPNDQVVEYEGLKVLLIGEELFNVFDGRTLDVEDIPGGVKLVISGIG